MVEQSNFRIEWETRRILDDEVARYDVDLFSAWPLFQQAVFRLSYLYECNWFIVINDYRFQFNYRPDLTTIFFKLPEMLEYVAANESGAFNLYFYEQGTDINISMTNVGTSVSLDFEKYEYSRFERIPAGKIQIRKQVFLRGWLKFIRKILREVVEECPEVADDEYFIDYEDTINDLEDLL